MTSKVTNKSGKAWSAGYYGNPIPEWAKDDSQLKQRYMEGQLDKEKQRLSTNEEIEKKHS